MSLHYLHNWKQYLIEDDYDYLIQYIENVKNNISNNEMIILSGPARTGKSTLMDDIKKYLGDEYCGYFETSGQMIYYENIKKLGIFCEIGPYTPSKRDSRAIINLIKYKQSLITATTDINRINNDLLDFCRIIDMEHIF